MSLPESGQLPEVLTAKEAAMYLRMSYNEFLVKCRAGKIPHFTVTGTRNQRSPILCRKVRLEQWISEMEEASIRPPDNKPKIRRLK